jgi:hypothetical protein
MEHLLQQHPTTKPKRRLRAFPELFRQHLHPQNQRGSTARQKLLMPTPQPALEKDAHPQYEKVLELVRAHKQYSPALGETPVLNLPKFDDITKYGL